MERVVVRAPSRLHFGLAAFGDASVPQFGGVGAMVDQPRLVVRMERAKSLTVVGADAERAEAFVRTWWGATRKAGEPGVNVSVERGTPAHVGLGSGTQLAMSVSAALARLFDDGDASDAYESWGPGRLAAAVGRGKRSAIGTFGFCEGGFLVDAGKTDAETLGSLERREPMPEAWRAVLIRPTDSPGLSGTAEQQQFDQLPPVPPEVTRQLWGEVHGEMLPALCAADCPRFGDAIYRYGVVAGTCFAPAQGGPFATPQLARLVEQLRRWGIRGVGQSSWGPTVFAIVEDQERADDLTRRLAGRTGVQSVIVSRFCNQGACILAVGREPD